MAILFDSTRPVKVPDAFGAGLLPMFDDQGNPIPRRPYSDADDAWAGRTSSRKFGPLIDRLEEAARDMESDAESWDRAEGEAEDLACQHAYGRSLRRWIAARRRLVSAMLHASVTAVLYRGRLYLARPGDQAAPAPCRPADWRVTVLDADGVALAN